MLPFSHGIWEADMLVIGLTGGIGSGKTMASNHFASLGISVVDADVCSRVVVEPGTPALQQIAEHFGPSVIMADGSMNRAHLRQRIFINPDEKTWLENLLHPLIGAEIMRQLQASQSPYTILVSPLLLESSQHKLANRILLIDAPEETQISRTTIRDGVAADNVQAIMQAQLPRRERQSRADDIILNDGDLLHLQNEVERLHQCYLEMAKTA